MLQSDHKNSYCFVFHNQQAYIYAFIVIVSRCYNRPGPSGVCGNSTICANPGYCGKFNLYFSAIDLFEFTGSISV